MRSMTPWMSEPESLTGGQVTGGQVTSDRMRAARRTCASASLATRGSQFPLRRSPLAIRCSPIAILFAVGCAHVENHYREDGPAKLTDWRTPSEIDIRERYQPAEARRRAWETAHAAAVDGTVTHWPLYLEDPFEDQGSGNSPLDPVQSGVNEYRLGWEDWIALPYSHARWTMNWLAFPVSAIVTPPWTVMESDGRLSRQALGYDHDAAPLSSNDAGDEDQPLMNTDER